MKTFFLGLSRAVGWRPGALHPRLPRAGGAHAGARAGPRQEERGSALRAPFRAAEERQLLVRPRATRHSSVGLPRATGF